MPYDNGDEMPNEEWVPDDPDDPDGLQTLIDMETGQEVETNYPQAPE